MSDRLYELDSFSTTDSYAPHECQKCGKTLASKYSLKRHVDSQHRHRNKRVKKTKRRRQSESEEDQEQSDYIWRQFLKNILRNWSIYSGKEMPKSEDELVDEENLEVIRNEMYEEMIRALNTHANLLKSPMYKKLERTREHILKVFDDEDDDDWNEAFRRAYELRKGLFSNFIIKNKDVFETYDESMEEENADEESNSDDDDVNSNYSHSSY